MEINIRSSSLVVVIFFWFYFMSSALLSSAKIAVWDDYLKQKEREAIQDGLDAVHPDPYSVNDHIKLKVREALEDSHDNSTRRSLRKYHGPCLATNPIDRCWRCDPNWAKNRKKLVKCSLGFGRRTLGGLHGRYYVVTDGSDDDLINPKKGTLRHAVLQNKPLWIIFKSDMVIRLQQELMITSYKTIDGRGFNVHIAFGCQMSIQFAKHIIIHGLHIHDIIQGNGGMIRDDHLHYGQRAMSDGDGISVFQSTHIWIDHNSLYNCIDGLIDVIQASTAITISNNHLTRHDHVMLFGASDQYQPDEKMQITVAFNHYGKGLIQRMPRCRLGFFHVVNNDYTHWIMYAIGGSQNATIISEGNRYIAPDDINHKEVTHRTNPLDPWHNWKWRSHKDKMKNGAFFVQSGTEPQRHLLKQDIIESKPGSYAGRLTRFAGTLNCKVNSPC